MKRTAIAIMIAVLVVAIGAGLCFAGLSAVHFKFANLDRTEYVTNTYDFGDPVREIQLDCETADVELAASPDGGCRVVCAESDRERYDVALEDGKLIVRTGEKKKLWPLFGFKSPKISVYLPAGQYELLKAVLGTGDITADDALSFDRLEADLSTGDLFLSGVQAQRVVVRGGTGDIRLSDMAPETADLSLSTGRMELVNVVCTGDLTCTSSTGDIRLTDVDGANLYLSASTGDITGTILTAKVFSAHASTGKVSVPGTTLGGRCEAETSTGDIRLSLKGE